MLQYTLIIEEEVGERAVLYLIPCTEITPKDQEALDLVKWRAPIPGYSPAESSDDEVMAAVKHVTKVLATKWRKYIHTGEELRHPVVTIVRIDWDYDTI